MHYIVSPLKFGFRLFVKFLDCIVYAKYEIYSYLISIIIRNNISVAIKGMHDVRFPQTMP